MLFLIVKININIDMTAAHSYMQSTNRSKPYNFYIQVYTPHALLPTDNITTFPAFVSSGITFTAPNLLESYKQNDVIP